MLVHCKNDWIGKLSSQCKDNYFIINPPVNLIIYSAVVYPSYINLLFSLHFVHFTFISDYDTKSGKKAILLEFCPNGRLSRILDKTKLMSEAVASRFFHQMFDAVKFIHSHRKLNYTCFRQIYSIYIKT